MNGRRGGAALIVGGMAAGGILSGAIATASVPDSTGVIHTCYSQAKGTWRPIDFPKQKCSTGETELAWNQTGPQGPQGLQGPQGAQGPQGPTGPAGTFSGHFESPSGDYTLDVTDAGISLAGPDAEVELQGSNVTVLATNNVKVQSGGDATVIGVKTRLGGSGSCAPAAAKGDLVNGGSVDDSGGPVTDAVISTGSANTLIC